eukprot:CAMPEP_0197075134 /NCGR_PEP_ID=MMETSP1384-20130603/211455_1 /TAXON_ID=29189 /ORGANISM="Ammonia sp." /LENGTH=1305 /DNA_ID=CAMNT_0042513977 /DNA_START=28 /DNA_END=3946 /DNA_ORIENTATION=-
MALDMSTEQFLAWNGQQNDDSSLGRARSMTKTLEKKTERSMVPANNTNSEFTQVVNRLKQLQDVSRKRKMVRKIPIITSRQADQTDFEREDMQNQIRTLRSEKQGLTNTVSSLFQQMQHLQEQNQSLAQRIEKLRRVLHESKSYAISLKQRNDNLAADMDFQLDLHEKQRRVWKTKIRASVSGTDMHSHSRAQTASNVLEPPSTALGILNESVVRGAAMSMTEEVFDLDQILREYESTIEKQRETIKYKNEQLEQQKSVLQYEKNQQYQELSKEINHLKNQKRAAGATKIGAAIREKPTISKLSKEINHLKNQRQQEIEELKIKLEQNNTELARAKQENARLAKTLEVTNNELNANRKLIEASRPTNASQTEQQLFQLEQDYLNLSEVLVASQHRLTNIENDLDEKQHALDDANRLIDEQNKTMEEYKKSIQLLQANLSESKSDQSDLLTALQQKWEECKEEVIRYKQKCRQLQHDKDELVAQNYARHDMETQGGDRPHHRYQDSGSSDNNQASKPPPQSPPDSVMSDNDNERKQDGAEEGGVGYNNDPELVVLVHDLRQKLTQKDNEVKSQEMLMKQLMEQQKAFQKRNKTLVTRLKAMKRSSQNNIKFDEGFNDNQQMQMQPQYQHQVYNGQVPDSVTVEMRSLYEHYIRNPIIQTQDMIERIRIKSQQIVAQGQNDYIIPQFDVMRINSSNAILIVIGDILEQRQTAINNESKKIQEIFSLKEQHEMVMNRNEQKRKHLVSNIRNLQAQLTKYEQQLHEVEDQKLFASTDLDNMMSEIERLKKENERIAQEFLQGANVWNSEKAIMSAERAQIVNDLSYIAHNLEQLILERQQFEDEADQFQSLYVNLIAHLRDRGMQVEVEYVDDDRVKSQYSQLAAKDDNFLSNRRKRNTMRLKLYQANTQPASLKEAEEPDNDYEQQQQNRRGAAVYSPSSSLSDMNSPNKKQSSSPSMSATPSPKAGAKNNIKSYRLKNMDSSSPPSSKHLPPQSVSADMGADLKGSSNKDDSRKPSLWKRVSQTQKKMKVTDVMQHEELLGPSSPRVKALSGSGPNLQSIPESGGSGLMNDAAKLPNSPRTSKNSRSKDSVSAEAADNDGKPIAMGVEDEADAYIPFDEPDEFNLLDEEYNKQAMDFVSLKDDNLISSADIDDENLTDVNMMAQNLLSRELADKEAGLPDLEGFLQKKSPTFGRGWQKRWVIVREYNIFYGRQKCDIKDIQDKAQTKKFLNAIPLLVVQYIVATDHSRSGTKFEIVARDPRTGDRRHYQWKAASREECDKWVHGLNTHKKLLAARLQFLANTGASAT